MRVGIISLLHESNTFLPGLTTLADFQRDHLLTGQAVADYFIGGHHEASGFFEGLAAEGLSVAPLFAARAMPSAAIEASTADRLLDMMLGQLGSAGPIDGLLVALHGAAVAENHPDLDGACLTRLRAALGPDRPMVCTLDAHANVSPAMVRMTDALIAYRTNPHLDQRDRGLEAAGLMARTLSGDVRPVQAAALPPLAIGIESQHTGRQPARQLYDLADRIRRREGLLSVSVILGFPYADVVEMGSGFIAVSDDRPDFARRAVSELAGLLWQRREDFAAGALAVEAALDAAESCRGEGPVGLLDIGDNVGGGSPGDGTLLAHAILKRKCFRGLVCLWDPPAADQARRAGAGARLSIRMGARSGFQPAPPLEGEVTVVRLHPGTFAELQARHGGQSAFDMGPTAVVTTDAGLTVMLTTHRVMPVSLAQLTCCGLDPAGFDVIVLKGVHAPVAAYQEVCPRLFLVDTPGVTRCGLDAFAYRRRRRPLYPLERDGPCDIEQTLVDGHRGAPDRAHRSDPP
ncbi:MAG: M81 family metallopeptidase [Phycisphaerae bacterium]|jgi:microcystin degradation protein MlrC